MEIRKREVTPPDQIDTVYVPEKLIHLFQNYPQNIVPIEQLIETITSGKQEEYMRHEYPAQLVEKMRTGGVVSYDDYYPLLFQRGKSAPIEHIKSFLRHGNWGSE